MLGALVALSPASSELFYGFSGGAPRDKQR
jgi:hypothetical protein